MKPWMVLLLATTMATTMAMATGPALAESPIEPGKVFVGAEGLTVAIVPLRPKTDNKVLIQITGSGSEFDGKVIPHTVKVMGERNTNFETKWHGRNWVT